MSRIFKSKKRAVVGVIAALVVTAVAFAYWTSTGGGSGSGSVASGQAVVLHGNVVDALVPGGNSSVTLTADQTNTTRKIGAITGTPSVDAGHSDCSASDFHFTGPSADETVSAGSGTQTLTAGSVSMDNSASNQDACKSATLSLTLSAAAPATP